MRYQHRYGASLIVLGALLVSGCGVTGPAHRDTPPDEVDAIVTMGLTRFEPAEIRVPVGGTVQWRNRSLITHTVTADPERASDPGNIELPRGADAFHSGEIAAGEVWSRQFTEPGTYRYVCLPHEHRGMRGTVIVEPE
jgi:plastocyanin